MSQMAVLMDKMRSVEAEIEAELAKQREALRFHFENRRVVFEKEVLEIHRAIKTRASRYFLPCQSAYRYDDTGNLFVLIPVALLDVFVSVFQAICFPIYKIPKVRRRDYLVFDRNHLAYLNFIEKINCAYCSYANGVIAFAREVAARTEVYWCPIKHARRMLDLIHTIGTSPTSVTPMAFANNSIKSPVRDRFRRTVPQAGRATHDDYYGRSSASIPRAPIEPVNSAFQGRMGGTGPNDPELPKGFCGQHETFGRSHKAQTLRSFLDRVSSRPSRGSDRSAVFAFRRRSSRKELCDRA